MIRLNGLDLNLLLVLDILLAERSPTAASARLHMTQSGVSNALARLRLHFGDELLVPSGRTMILTPLARDLMEPVRDLITRAQVITEIRREFNPAQSQRKFIVNVSDYVAMFLMPEVMRRVARLAPHMIIQLDAVAVGVMDRFEAGIVDLMIVPQHTLDTINPSRYLFDESFCCVAWEGNREVGDQITLEQYLGSEHVSVQNRNPISRHHVDAFMYSNGYDRKVVATSPNYTLMPEYITGTNRLGTVHRRVAERYREEFGLKVLDTPFSIPPVREYVSWHGHRREDEATLWFVQLLEQVAAEI